MTWEQIIELLRVAVEAWYPGDEPRGVVISLASGRKVRCKILPWEGRGGAASEGAAERPGWASGPEPKHSDDFELVYWPGLGRFSLSPTQADCVRVLWEAREEGKPGLDQQVILRKAGAASTRLRDIFRDRGDQPNPLGALIVQVQGVPAMYRLAPLPGEGNPSPDAPQ